MTCSLSRTTRLSYHFAFLASLREAPKLQTWRELQSIISHHSTQNIGKTSHLYPKTRQSTTLNNNNKVYQGFKHCTRMHAQCTRNKKHPEGKRKSLVKQPDKMTLCLLRACFFVIQTYMRWKASCVDKSELTTQAWNMRRSCLPV